MPKAKASANSHMNLNIDADLVAWVSFASAIHDESKTAYINRAIREDMERASPERLAAFSAFMDARP